MVCDGYAFFIPTLPSGLLLLLKKTLLFYSVLSIKCLSVLETLLCWFRGSRVFLCCYRVFSFIPVCKSGCFGQFYARVLQICRLWQWQLDRPLPWQLDFSCFCFWQRPGISGLFVYELYSVTASIKFNISIVLYNPFLLKKWQCRNLHYRFQN